MKLTGINKNVVTLSFASFLTDISSEMLYPIIPIFLTSVLGASMPVLGLIEGTAESAASILKAFSGWLSDVSRKRRPFVIGGYFLSSVGKLLFFAAYSWPAVLLARLVDRIGKGVRTSPRDAMLADSCEPEYVGKAFGFHRAMDTAGACLGPLIALFLIYALKENLRIVFLVSFVPAIIAVFLLIRYLKEVSAASHVDSGPSCAGDTGRPHISKETCRPELAPIFWKFIIISAIFSIGNSSDAFLIMRAKGVGLSTAMVVLAYVVYNISYSALSLPAGSLSDKIGRKAVIIGGYIIFALVYLGFALSAGTRTVWALFFIYGFYIAMTDGVSKAFVADVVGSRSRGTAMGVYHCVTGFAAFFASLIAGLLWTYVGAPAPFLYGAAMSLLSCAVFMIIIR